MLAVPVSNVGVTVVLPVSVSVQVATPVHSPDQPANVVPALGVAVKVTVVPGGKLALQADVQLIPAGTLVTVPVPVPAGATPS